MKIIISYLFLFFPIVAIFSQDQGILLENKNSDRTDFLKEHKRIKVITSDGNHFYGRFTIVNDNTIMIDNSNIPLDQIVRIKRKSLTSSILSPIIPVIGVVFILGGTGVAATEGSGAIVGVGLISSGFTMTLASLISNKHKKEKWVYKIGTNPYN